MRRWLPKPQRRPAPLFLRRRFYVFSALLCAIFDDLRCGIGGGVAGVLRIVFVALEERAQTARAAVRVVSKSFSGVFSFLLFVLRVVFGVMKPAARSRRALLRSLASTRGDFSGAAVCRFAGAADFPFRLLGGIARGVAPAGNDFLLASGGVFLQLRRFFGGDFFQFGGAASRVIGFFVRGRGDIFGGRGDALRFVLRRRSGVLRSRSDIASTRGGAGWRRNARPVKRRRLFQRRVR